MPLIMNTTNEEQHVTVFGKHFTFKPKQIKNMNESFAKYLATERLDQGIIGLDDRFEEDTEFKNTEEGKALLEQAEERGIKSYVDFHRSIVANNQISLRRDLEKAGIKAGPEVYASPGELRSARIVASYGKADADQAQKNADEMKKLVSEMKK